MKKIVKIAFVMLLSIGFLNVQAQFQIGNDIEGAVALDFAGRSIALNTDGTIVAVGAEGNDANGSEAGQLRVFQFTAGDWQQIGGDINGDAAGDQFGITVSMNDAGDIVAIGAHYNDQAGTTAGQVKVFGFNNGNWEQIGSDILGAFAGDAFGASVSLNSAGDILAVGAPSSDEGGSASGIVSVYRNNAGTWEQIGANIVGAAAVDQFGKALTLNSDGTILAIGGFGNDDAGAEAGHVKIFRNSADSWVQVGNTILGSAAGDEFGKALSINDAGNIVAIGASKNDAISENAGQVRIFRNESDVWTQLGNSMESLAVDDNLGNAVSISGDGMFVAVGVLNSNSPGSNTGQIRLYAYQSDNWQLYSTPLNGEANNDYFGYSVALNQNGSVVAGGAFGNDGIGNAAGHVRVYNTCLIDQTSPVPSLSTLPDLINQCAIESLVEPQATDACSGSVTVSHNATLPISQEGTNTITWTFDDGHGNTTTQTQNAIITHNPSTIVCPTDQVFNLTEGQNYYTSIGSELEPSVALDCGIDVVLNNFNNQTGLMGEHIPVGTTTIVWTVTDSYGYDMSCTFDVTVNIFVGIKPIDNNEMMIYPNPNNGLMRIESSYVNIKDVKIYRPDATTVFEQSYNGASSVQIDLSTQIHEGLYFVEIIDLKGNSKTLKFIKE